MALRRLWPPLVVLTVTVMLMLTLTLQLAAALPTLNPTHLHHALLPLPQSLEARGMDFTQPPALEETIEEVQKILAQDPTLPRLTRGEIQELYEKVTREEFEKSMSAGDLGRADSMRALMLVLPYNTDNNTEENLQELYTRPPVTKVIEAYTPPQPIKFVTADPSATTKAVQQSADGAGGQLAATTYKPTYTVNMKPGQGQQPSATTYHPSPPAPLLYKMQPSVGYPAPAVAAPSPFQPVTFPPLIFDYGTAVQMGMTETPKTPSHQRFSSHYNAKNTNFLKKKPIKTSSPTSTVMPVADVLETLGIVGQPQRKRHHFSSVSAEDFFAVEESAPQPVISTFVPPPQQSYTPQITPEAYSSFKPLNIGEEIRVKPEVEGYLTRFGIVGGRKRKAMTKDNKTGGTDVEQVGAQTEIATARVPGAVPTPSELEKLLENLQELERLNVRPKQQPKPTAAPTTTTTTTTTSTTTTTTTPKPTTTTTESSELITNGFPLLIEPKKPRRRIDPQLDLNFGAAGNHHSDSPPSTAGGNDGQLAKLLENLQELEKLRITPANALKPVPQPAATTPQTPRPTASTTTTATTPMPSAAEAAAPVQSQTLTNRFSEFNYLPAAQTPKAATTSAMQPPDLQQLQRVLKQLQVFEQANARTSIPSFVPIPTTTTTTTKTPTRRPAAAVGGAAGNQLNFGLTDFAQLRKLLTDDGELERLYEQARARQAPKTTTTTTTTSTTKKPIPTLDDLQQLQQYLAAFDRRSGTATPTKPTATASTITATASAPNAPTQTLSSSSSLAQRIALANLMQQFPVQTSAPSIATTSTPAASVGNADLLALINRVHELERLSNRPQPTSTTTSTTTTQPPVTTASTTTTTTTTPAPGMPFLGFTSRNVKASANDLRVPSNDFAQLQQLYRQVSGETGDYGAVEISTAATTGFKANRPATAVVNKQQLIDLTNETGGGGGAGFGGIGDLQTVDANDFVQLQKLLSKVQELERVKITSTSSEERRPTHVPHLVTAASVPAASAVQLNDVNADAKRPQFIYPEKKRQPAGESLLVKGDDEGGAAADEFDGFDDLKLELPAYELSTARPNAHVKKDGATLLPPPPEVSSSEELRDLAHPTSSKAGSSGSGSGGDALQRLLFGQLSDEAERNAYKNLQPPMIMKTVPSSAAPPPTAAGGAVFVTKEPPRFIATRRPQDVTPSPASAGTAAQADLAELQKLLSNAQELEKLGVTLPHELSQQIEQKLTLPNELPPALATPTATVPPMASNGGVEQTSRQSESMSTAMTSEPPEEKTVVFSVTTMKSPPSLKRPAAPPPPSAPSETALELPVVSYNKVIEAAVRQAASRFGFSTEQPQGFRRRSDVSVDEDDMFVSERRADERVDEDDDDDLMGEFSELNYQLAVPPEINSMAVTAAESEGAATAQPDADLSELQRLIGNLQELQKLNISVSSDLLRQADQRYLQSVQQSNKAANGGDGGDPEAADKKARRQSATEAPTPAATSTDEDSGTDATSPAPDVMIVTPIPNEEVDITTAITTTTTTTTAPAASAAELDDSSTPTPAPTRINLGLGIASDNVAEETLSKDVTPTATTDSPTTTTTTATTTEEEPRNGSLVDLEASFGPDPIEMASPPPKKKNGFYFLADWNSFLEVGDGDDQVVVRFSPKIGDPRLFLPVKVP